MEDVTIGMPCLPLVIYLLDLVQKMNVFGP